MLKSVISKSTTVVTKILEGGRCYKSHLDPPLQLNDVVNAVIYGLISLLTTSPNTSAKKLKS